MIKEVKGWIIVNVMRGGMRVVKRLGLGRLKDSEIAIEINLKIDVPEKPLLKAEGIITLSQTQMSNIAIEAISDNSEVKK